MTRSAAHHSQDTPTSMTLWGHDFVDDRDLTPAQWFELAQLTTAQARAQPSTGDGHPAPGPRMRHHHVVVVGPGKQTGNLAHAAASEGAHIRRESLSRSPARQAQHLSRSADAIICNDRDTALVLSANASVPVLLEDNEVRQTITALAYIAQMLEAPGTDPAAITVAYVGDCRTGAARSLLTGCAQLGMDVRMVAPVSWYAASPEQIVAARELARTTGARIRQTSLIAHGTHGARFIVAAPVPERADNDRARMHRLPHWTRYDPDPRPAIHGPASSMLTGAGPYRTHAARAIITATLGNTAHSRGA